MYGLLLCAITFLILFLRKKPDNNNATFKISLGFISSDFIVSKSKLIKGIVSVSILLLLIVYYAELDFSGFFPKKIRMTVHFDQSGVKKLMSHISIDEIDGMPIDRNDSTSIFVYIKKSDSTIFNHFGIRDYFSKALLLNQARLESKGETRFIVKKKDGFQNYYIEESLGQLTHSLFEPKKEIREIKTSFTKIVSPNDKIDVDISSLLIGKEIIISPLFVECLINNPNATEKELIEMDHFLYGVTSIKVFPIPKYSNTIYLYRVNGKLVPIGYAVYIAEE